MYTHTCTHTLNKCKEIKTNRQTQQLQDKPWNTASTKSECQPSLKQERAGFKFNSEDYQVHFYTTAWRGNRDVTRSFSCFFSLWNPSSKVSLCCAFLRYLQEYNRDAETLWTRTMQIPGHRRFMSNRQVIPSRSEGTGPWLLEEQRVLRQEDHKFGAVLVCFLLLYCYNRTLTESHLGSTGLFGLHVLIMVPERS